MPRRSPCQTPRGPCTSRARLPQRLSCSPAITVLTRWRGMSGSSGSRATTPTAGYGRRRAIPNKAERYPRDAPEAMRARVDRGEFEGVPYLYDQSQNVARAYGAKTTPDVFVLDATGVLRYRGAPDADHDDPAQNAAFLRGALDAMLDGRDPNPVETPPVGCSIKWKA